MSTPAKTVETAAKVPTIGSAAEEALAEAKQRRAALDAKAAALGAVKEISGREGPDPVRYDDWEVKGLASDF